MPEILYTLEEIRVSRRNEDFIVTFEDGEEVLVEDYEVDNVTSNLRTVIVSQEEVALILGFLIYSKRSNKAKFSWSDSIKEACLASVTAEFFKELSSEEILKYLKGKKWHEIVSIYQSQNPIMELIGEESEDDDEE